MEEPVKFWFENPPKDRIRVGFIGCGDHAFRNVYPAGAAPSTVAFTKLVLPVGLGCC